MLANMISSHTPSSCTCWPNMLLSSHHTLHDAHNGQTSFHHTLLFDKQTCWPNMLSSYHQTLHHIEELALNSWHARDKSCEDSITAVQCFHSIISDWSTVKNKNNFPLLWPNILNVQIVNIWKTSLGYWLLFIAKQYWIIIDFYTHSGDKPGASNIFVCLFGSFFFVFFLYAFYNSVINSKPEK